MLSTKVPWTIKTVLSVHILRFIMGLVLVRLLYPLFFTVDSFTAEMTDRIVVILIVWWVVHKHGFSFSQLSLSTEQLGKNLIWGIGAGFLLLAVSVYSERLYSAVLLLTPTQHPLVEQVQKAFSWYQLAIPLLLAGIMAPVAEEVLYRLFTFLPMKDQWGIWGGAAASSLVFALMHFNLYWLGEIMVVGFGLALLYYWSGSLVSAMVAHSIINTTKILMIFFGIPIV